MAENKSEDALLQNAGEEEPVKWDYTSSRQTLITGAVGLGLNLLVIVLVILYRTVPAVHDFIGGKT